MMSMKNTERKKTSTGRALEEKEPIKLGLNVSLVVFDMDGVIADTAKGHKLAWQEYMDRFDRIFTDAEFEAIFGTGNKELCAILFPEQNLNDEDVNRIGNEKEELFRIISRGNLDTYDGFFEFLNLCDSMGIPMVVGSSACRKNVDFVLEEVGVAERFVATVSADEVKEAKPEPDIFLKAAELAGCLPEECLVIEDSRMGIAAARNAGMRVVGLTTTHAAEELSGTDLLAADFRELADLIG